MAGIPPNHQPATHGRQQAAATPPGVAPAQVPQMFGGLASSLTPEQHRQLQQQAVEHAQRIQAGLAQPDALRMSSGFGASPPFAGSPQQAGLTPQPRMQWRPQTAQPAMGVGGAAPGVQQLLPSTPQQHQQQPQQQHQQQQQLQQHQPLPQQQQQVRPVGMPPPATQQQHHHHQQQQQRQVVRAAEAVPAARRMIKKRKAPEQLLADKVAAFVPQSALFQQLAGLEREVDGLLARKHAEVAAATRACPSVPKKLRVYLLATHSNQPSAAAAAAAAPAAPAGQAAAAAGRSKAGGPDGGPPAWVFRLHGRLLDPSGEPPQKGLPPAPEPFSHYLRSVRIELVPEEKGQQPTEALRWSAAQHTEPAREAFEVRRLGSGAFRAKVTLEVNWQPQRFKLSPSLGSLLGAQSDTRARVLQAACAYIVRQKLQDPLQPGTVRCDARLKGVLGDAVVQMSGVAERLAPHLSPAPPIEMTYLIKPSGPSPSVPDCYDIDIEVPLPPAAAAPALLNKLGPANDVEPINTRIIGLTKQINEHARRRTFLLGFSQSPADFINGLLASQARDLRTFKSEHADVASMYAPTRTELFHGRWVEDAVLKYTRSTF